MWPIVLFFILIILLYIIYTFLRFKKYQKLTSESLEEVLSNLKARSELLLALAKLIGKEFDQENSRVNEALELRAQCVSESDLQSRAEQEDKLIQHTQELLTKLNEAEPSQELFDLQKQAQLIENKLTVSIRYYNHYADNVIRMVETFPSSILARQLNIQAPQHFHLQKNLNQAESH